MFFLRDFQGFCFIGIIKFGDIGGFWGFRRVGFVF